MMNDEKFADLMRTAGQDYNRPPDLPPLDEMWLAIERARTAPLQVVEDEPHPFRQPAKRSWLSSTWLRMAAMLALGLALGRITATRQSSAAPTVATANAVETRNPGTTRVPGEYREVTNEYLGQTAALLISLPGELDNKRTDSAFVTRADELLAQTRRLLDSPAATDPELRTLFEDLELVLVQVVRLPREHDRTRIELLNQALQQRAVISRLRNAVADHIAD